MTLSLLPILVFNAAVSVILVFCWHCIWVVDLVVLIMMVVVIMVVVVVVMV